MMIYDTIYHIMDDILFTVIEAVCSCYILEEMMKVFVLQ